MVPRLISQIEAPFVVEALSSPRQASGLRDKDDLPRPGNSLRYFRLLVTPTNLMALAIVLLVTVVVATIDAGVDVDALG